MFVVQFRGFVAVTTIVSILLEQDHEYFVNFFCSYSCLISFYDLSIEHPALFIFTRKNDATWLFSHTIYPEALDCIKYGIGISQMNTCRG